MKMKTMWTTRQAIELVRELHCTAFNAGWNLHLGGGLLTTCDKSDKDADILAMPRYQTDTHLLAPIVEHLKGKQWTVEGMLTLPHRIVYTFKRREKVLEIIFVALSHAEGKKSAANQSSREERAKERAQARIRLVCDLFTNGQRIEAARRAKRIEIWDLIDHLRQNSDYSKAEATLTACAIKGHINSFQYASAISGD